MKILISGIFGRMGNAVLSVVKDYEDIDVVAGFDVRCGEVENVPVYDDVENLPPVDCAVDFSSPDGFLKILNYCAHKNIPLVSGTTGLDDEHFSTMKQFSEKIPIFYASNMSLAVAFVGGVVSDAARIFPDGDVEIVERHHRHKADAPSGTALTLAKEVLSSRGLDESFLIFGRYGRTGERPRNQIAIHSLRGGEVFGEHNIYISMPYEEIVITHRALDRKLFAVGAINAIKYLAKMNAGLYSIKNLLNVCR